MRAYIDELMNQFIQEAEASPLLCADMAQMENYIAESYNNRAFIELLQNADDAKSRKVFITWREGCLYVANDGTLFTREDIASICRSGASSKKRGENIGYRGVGFKSATCFSQQILISSGECLFAFSKEHMAKLLKVEPRQVPTVRIPYNVDFNDLDPAVQQNILQIRDLGYQTVFVFINASRHVCEEEIQSIDVNSIIFLHNIQDVLIDNTLKYAHLLRSWFTLERDTIMKVTDEITGRSKEWIMYGDESSYRLAVPYNEPEYYQSVDNVFHCFLPTMDKTGFGFRINGDFSTEPSRKHLVKDTSTDMELVRCSGFICDSISTAIRKRDKFSLQLIQAIVEYKPANQFSTKLFAELHDLMHREKVAPEYHGNDVSLKEAVLLPVWTDSTLVQALDSVLPGTRSLLIEPESIIREMYILFGCEQLSVESMMKIMLNSSLVQLISTDVSISMVLSCAEAMKENGDNSPGNLFVKCDDGSVSELENAVANSVYAERFFSMARTMVDRGTVQWLSEKLRAGHDTASPVSSILNRRKKVLNKWQTAEQLCYEIERLKGNTVKNVSEQNIGYDVLSISPSGQMTYYEVKSLKTPGEPFIMTNNEYTTAHKYGDDYCLCLIAQTNPPMVQYIRNPLQADVHIEKRVRMWEWIYSDYKGSFEEIDF